MPYELDWLVPRRVIVLRADTTLLLSDIQTGSPKLIAMLDAGTSPVHIFFDISRMKSYPVRVSTVADASTYMRHPNLGWLVVYGISSMTLEKVISILNMLTRVRCQTVSSRVEAFQFLSEQDAEIAGFLNTLDPNG